LTACGITAPVGRIPFIAAENYRIRSGAKSPCGWARCVLFIEVYLGAPVRLVDIARCSKGIRFAVRLLYLAMVTRLPRIDVPINLRG